MEETDLSRLVQGPLPTEVGAKHWDSPVWELYPALNPKNPFSEFSALNTLTPPLTLNFGVMSNDASPKAA